MRCVSVRVCKQNMSEVGTVSYECACKVSS
jgi:hypothetical protein